MMDGIVAMHQFGFTERYYIIFANPIAFSPGEALKVAMGTPLLRAVDDQFYPNLIIHFVPRVNDVEGFRVDTKVQGNVYHSINAFDMPDGSVVVDAYVSNLSAARESAQFELDPQHPVYDHSGRTQRFHVSHDVVHTGAICPSVDSTIDFHAVNPKFLGVPHRYEYLVSHVRHRDIKTGDTTFVESRLFKLDVKFENDNPLDFDQTKTLVQSRSSRQWKKKDGISCFLRTPLYVPRQGSHGEDDGYLMAWSYDEEPDHPREHLRSYILIFEASSVKALMRIPLPEDIVIPYSVHSFQYSREDIERAKGRSAPFLWRENSIRIEKIKKTPVKTLSREDLKMKKPSREKNLARGLTVIN
jgi:all-trans-8'-apo-beta-carotenal 15,15'-oxygenase